ncbi:protein kinase [Nonomuraea sp. B5E05]|uniref:serine/threonine protein kinase n=1 Tax=Nonomuraea sp. B5E05 TaxID=3153569 RepID=UPI003260B874
MAEKDSPQPERIGSHEIVGQVGTGPRGVVHLGRKSDDSDQVAVKTLAVGPAADPDFVARLKRVTRVSNSNIARTIDAGVHEGRLYVVRAHVEGRSLADTVAEDGPLTGDALERVAVGMLTALTAVHLAGFAHRGLTPSNVILTGEALRVTDIEIGDPAGEIGYRAPEQINGLQYGPYADVFAWAATVVFAATGAAPFGHDAQAVLNGAPEVGDLPEPLRQVVLAALTKDPGARPTTSTAMLRLLGDANAPMPAPPIDGVPVPPPAPAGGPPAQEPPAIQPIQLSIEGVRSPMGGPMPPQPMTPGPVPPPGMGPVQHGPVPPGAMQQGPMGPAPLQGPAQSGQLEHGSPQGQVPSAPPAWGPPPGQQPPAQDAQQNWQPPTVPRQAGDQQRRPFPIGLVASVTAVVLLSGLGLWGASHYSNNVSFSPIAAASDEPAPGEVSKSAGSVGVGPTQPQAEVTAPWATTTPSPDENGVGPMTLPTDATTASPPEVPVLTSVPTPPQVTTQPVPIPTVTTTAAPTATTTPSKTPKPRATVTKTVEPSRTPTQTPSKTPTKTQEPTKEPTKEPTREPEPTPTKAPTTKAPEQPKPTKSSAKPTPKKNPYSATGVCKGGFVVQRSSSFEGGTTYQLWNNSTGQNCVVTLKSGADVGKATKVSATLEVKGGSSKTDSGNFEYYAGPVILSAKGKCVRYSGSTSHGSTSADWANCG